MLRLLRPQRDTTPNRGYYSPASMRSATFTHFIAGPLAFRPKCPSGDNLQIARQFRNAIRWPEMLTEKDRFSLDKRDSKHLVTLIIRDSINELCATQGILPDLDILINNIY
jgi:hypothetical protein